MPEHEFIYAGKTIKAHWSTDVPAEAVESLLTMEFIANDLPKSGNGHLAAAQADYIVVGAKPKRKTPAKATAGRKKSK